MQVIEVTKRTPELIGELVQIWEESVKETHTFLSDSEIQSIKQYVPQAIEAVEHLIVIKDDHDNMMAFMGIENQRLEMLFVTPESRGKGIGKKLLTYGISNFDVNELTVNEQNPQAVGFYEHMGFETYKRTDMDEEGNPYPLLYMKLK